jgi:hypothetical protein
MSKSSVWICISNGNINGLEINSCFFLFNSPSELTFWITLVLSDSFGVKKKGSYITRANKVGTQLKYFCPSNFDYSETDKNPQVS